MTAHSAASPIEDRPVDMASPVGVRRRMVARGVELNDLAIERRRCDVEGAG